MNKLTPTLLYAVLAVLPLLGTNAKTEKSSSDKAHRIVFEVTMEGPEQWTAALNNVENIRVALGTAIEIEVVAHSKGLGMLISKDNALTDRMKMLADGGVVFAACENTMRRKNVKKEDLLPFATTVPSGVAEVVLKQEAGWAYLKGGS